MFLSLNTSLIGWQKESSSGAFAMEILELIPHAHLASFLKWLPR
jgi:hypothetical protein